jgi:hypothetical protein
MVLTSTIRLPFPFGPYSELSSWITSGFFLVTITMLKSDIPSQCVRPLGFF